MIGLSLSMCIKDVLSGRVPEAKVTKIVTNTRANSDSDWDRLIGRYHSIYWRGHTTDQVLALIARLREQDKIEQPRVNHPDHEHHINKGWWVPDDTYDSTSTERAGVLS